jgi:3-dehydroquinate dehydratase-2
MKRDLNYYREQIDKTDDEILRLFKERLEIAEQIAGYKEENGIPIFDPQREQEKIADIIGKANSEIRPHAKKLYSTLFEISRAHQAAVIAPVKKKILVINGPNLNLLGIRETSIYGNQSYNDLVEFIRGVCAESDVQVEIFQSNHEGEIVDKIQEFALENGVGNFAEGENATAGSAGIVINPAAYTHTSIAILDALKAVGIPAVEVHLSDIGSREPYRRISYVREACAACFMGMGFEGYAEALRYLAENV